MCRPSPETMSRKPLNPKRKGSTKSQVPDEEDTLAVRLRRYYNRQGVYAGFGKQRFMDLCRLTQLLPDELGLLVGLTSHQLGVRLNRNKFDVPSTLHLMIVEDAFKTLRYADHVPKMVTPWHLVAKADKTLTP